jgi:hypothetical protein
VAVTPDDQRRAEDAAEVARAGSHLALTIMRIVPVGETRSRALRQLADAVLLAIAAIGGPSRSEKR